ncbi:MAG: adenylate/guanylate cyclase domain-containing protein [Ignavibacteria bacterium]|nr:adenylate/guanylate cyclase domain-containing protein [Ignavibacteria bacterium]
MKSYCKYKSLEDYLSANPLDIDVSLDDGGGVSFPLKGRKINATILFIDIVNFSGRTKNLSPIETLIFVNNFFTWITAEALISSPCIVDKYIGDEIMVIFSTEFGNKNPFVEALKSAIRILAFDYLCYFPHIGISSGDVIIGYVGTPKRFNCSVFGYPVTLAKRCTSVNSQIAFPDELWKNYSFEQICPKLEFKKPNGSIYKHNFNVKIKEPWIEDFKNIGKVKVRGLNRESMIFSSITAENRVKQNMKYLLEKGFIKNNI